MSDRGMANPYASPETKSEPDRGTVRYIRLSVLCIATAFVGLITVALSNTTGAPLIGYLPDPVGFVLAAALAIFVAWLACLEWFGSKERLYRTKWIAVPVALLSMVAVLRFGMLFQSDPSGIFRQFPALMLSPVPPVIALWYVFNVFRRPVPRAGAQQEE